MDAEAVPELAGVDGCGCSVACDSGAELGGAEFRLAAGVRGDDVLGEGSSSGADRTELLPMVKPMPKKMAHRITSPKNSASILPVPRVISVSVASSRGTVVTGLIEF